MGPLDQPNNALRRPAASGFSRLTSFGRLIIVWPSLTDVDPGPQFPSLVRMIVEVPKGSANKYEYDPQLGVFRLDRSLYSPMHFPGDYGFVPGTIAEDGEPLDILCLTSESSFPGCSIDVRPFGMLDMIDASHVDHKILAVPAKDPRFSAISEVEQFFPHIRREVEHFFTIYKELESGGMSMEGWHDHDAALATLRRSRETYLNSTARTPA